MDNEREVTSDKVTALVERSKQVFLREVINEFARQQQQYDLEQEFAKTRRNRSWYVPGTIIVLVALFSGVVIGVTRYIDSQSTSIDVEVADFADINLREVLDEAQRLQNELNAALRQRAQLIEERDSQVEAIDRQLQQDVSLLNASGLGAAEQRRRSTLLREQAGRDQQSVEADFQPRIEALDARIAELQAQIAEYDARQLAQAEEQQRILDSQRELSQLELDRTVTQYETEIADLTQRYESEISQLEAFQTDFERTIRARHARELSSLREQYREQIASLILRFNPDLSEERVGRLLDDPLPAGLDTFGELAPFDETLEVAGVASAGEYRSLVVQVARLYEILDRLEQVPYENSVPAALSQLEVRAIDVVARYQSIWTALATAVRDRDDAISARSRQVESFVHALDEFSRSNGSVGWVLDARDDQAIVVHIGSWFAGEVPDVGYVFRRDDEYVGQVEFLEFGDVVTARALETVPGTEFRSFDQVLIDVE